MRDSNTGDRNTGNFNTGDSNTGNFNTGNWNTGNRNTGNWNTGNFNTGDSNTGNFNTGDSNTGNWNTGDSNTGDWNTSNSNTGYFCENDGPVLFFDQPCRMTREEAVDAIPWVDLPIGCEWIQRQDMTPEEVASNPNCDHIGGYLKKRMMPINEAFPLVWATLDQETKDQFMNLPNFDADKFQRITGVDVRAEQKHPVVAAEAEKTADRITVGGVEYYLVPVKEQA